MTAKRRPLQSRKWRQNFFTTRGARRKVIAPVFPYPFFENKKIRPTLFGRIKRAYSVKQKQVLSGETPTRKIYPLARALLARFFSRSLLGYNLLDRGLLGYGFLGRGLLGYGFLGRGLLGGGFFSYCFLCYFFYYFFCCHDFYVFGFVSLHCPRTQPENPDAREELAMKLYVRNS